MNPDMAPIPLVLELTAALAGEGIVYCHWKSNNSLALAERGETDLDLLVSRRQGSQFESVMGSLGFVTAARPHVKDAPGVAHYFGYDASADRLVHVHAHYQLVLGHDRTKNYRLPIEDAYLASAEVHGIFPIPSPEFEYAVLIVRMVLKYAILDEIFWRGLRGRRAGPKRSEQDELDSLGAQLDRDRLKLVVEEHLPFIGPDLFADAERVATLKTSIRERLSVASRIHSALSPHARGSAALDAWLRVWRRFAMTLRRRAGRRVGFRPATGGALVAILGGDGAGKSTAIEEISVWLSRDFDVSRVHLGKPSWSWTTYAVRAVLKAAATAGLVKDIPPSASEADKEISQSQNRRLFWHACKARDRYREYRKARRAANRGIMVISDRYPHSALSRTDVPQIARLLTEPPGAIHSWLIRFEDRYHSRVAKPDLAFVLVLDPEEAVRRKTDEPADYVMERSTEIWETDWESEDVHVIDASRPREVVAAEIKQIIWDWLV